jgi:hypothetical protein
LEQLVGALRHERVDPKLAVIRLAPPAVAILGTIIHGQQDRRCWQTIHESIDHILAFGIDPVHVVENEQQRLDAALTQ